jgi:hypothetical protein
MRPSSALCALIVSACATTAHTPTVEEQCNAGGSTKWTILAESPSFADEVLDLQYNGKIIRSWFGEMRPPVSDAWLQSSTGEFRYCRYTPNAEPCVAGVSTADFKFEADHWSTKGVMELICVTADAKGNR